MTDIMLPWPPSILSPNARAHWAAKRKATKQARVDGYYATIASNAEKPISKAINGTGRIHLWAHFYAPDKRRRDDDNLLSSLKPYRDGIAEALGIDDTRFQSHPVLENEVVKGGRVVVRLVSE